MPELALDFLYGQAVARCDHHIDKVFEGYYTLQCMTSGALALSIGERNWQLEGAWLWSCYPGPQIRFHAVEAKTTWNHRFIAFRGPRVQEWAASGLFPIEPQPLPAHADIVARFDELLATPVAGDALAPLQATHLLEGILLALASARRRPPADPLVTQALTHLQESAYHGDCDELASLLGVSPRTLRRRFTAATGQSPQQHLLQHRLSRARQLLAETGLPIKQIARQLGYSDVFFFTRQFAQLTGVPPARYRQSCAG